MVGDSEDDLLVTAACDHTDRALEVHGVAWSKQSAPDFIGDLAWDYASVEAGFDAFTLRAWVTTNGTEQLIQDGSVAELLSPRYWVDELRAAGLLRPHTLVMSGTIPMIPWVDQFAERWRVELADQQGQVSRVDYTVEVLPEPWQ